MAKADNSSIGYGRFALKRNTLYEQPRRFTAEAGAFSADSPAVVEPDNVRGLYIAS